MLSLVTLSIITRRSLARGAPRISLRSAILGRGKKAYLSSFTYYLLLIIIYIKFIPLRGII